MPSNIIIKTNIITTKKKISSEINKINFKSFIFDYME